ncbi:glycosyltransferase [Candidatus Parcubacteria bacterium]|nr:MAG: glycosyltransferase [Candidatus Parcubacteria bacterium]
MNFLFSIVIPVCNEKDSLRELTKKVQTRLSSFKKPYEIIFIDDGSTDTSLDVLNDLKRHFENISVYSFRKNVGKTYALMLGFSKAKGEYIVTLDADLQDDPQSIKELFSKIKRGNYDLVTGWRKDRKDSFKKKILSSFSNKIISTLFDLKIHDLNSGIKIYKSSVAKDLKLYGGMHRFIPLIASEMGYKVGETEVLHLERRYGESKYKMTKFISDIPDLISVYFLTRYTRRPLHFFGKFGSLVFLIGFIFFIYLGFSWLGGNPIGTRPLFLFALILILTGIQIVFTGVIADLIINKGFRDDDIFPLKYD